jgi:hypothetical protein
VGAAEVVLLARARARRAEEEREAALDVVGRDQQVRERVAQPRVAQVGREGAVERAVVVALVEQPVRGGDALDQRAVEDLRALGAVELGELLGRVHGPAVRPRAGEAAGEDPTGRGAGDQVEELGGRAPGAALDLGQHERRDEAADAAAVDGEDLHGALTRRRLGIPLICVRPASGRLAPP